MSDPREKHLTHPAFHDLMDRVRRGDEAAVRILHDDYSEAVEREVRFALYDSRLRRIVGESDICQSVFMRFCVGLWAGNYEIETPGQLVALLKTMVRSRVVDWARYAKADRRDIRRNQSLEFEESASPRHRDPTPSEIVSNNELLTRFRERLSPRELRILELKQDRRKWAEIAQELGEASAEAIRKQYERAFERVLAELGLSREDAD